VAISLWQADELLLRMRQSDLVKEYLLSQSATESDDIDHLLARLDDFEPVSKLLDRARAATRDESSESRFYRGTIPDWLDILCNYDAPREVTGQLWQWISERLTLSPRTSVAVLLGNPGEGKSTVLMRTAYELVNQGYKVLYLKEDRLSISADELAHISPGATLIIVIDRLTRFAPETLQGFCERLHRMPLRILILGASVRSVWHAADMHLEDVVDITPFEVGRLTDFEIEWLLAKLRANSHLGLLQGMSADEQQRILRRKSGRQLLVIMAEINGGGSMAAHVQRELRNVQLKSSLARRAISYVSATHRFDLPLPVRVLKSVLPGLDVDCVLLPLTEGTLSLIAAKGEPALVTRHSLFAESVVSSEPSTDSVYRDLIASWDRSDGRTVARLLRLLSLKDKHLAAELLTDACELFNVGSTLLNISALTAGERGDAVTARDTFRLATSKYPDDTVAWATWGNFERTHGNLGASLEPEPETARWLLRRALSIAPDHRHALCSLALLESNSRNLGAIDIPFTARWLFYRAYQLNPFDARTLRHWAIGEAKRDHMGNVDFREEYSARWLFSKAFEMEPRNFTTVTAWADAEAISGNIGTIGAPESFSARWLFQRATELRPQDVVPWCAWAVCESASGNIGEATSPAPYTARWLFGRALDVKPESFETLTAAADMEWHTAKNIRRAEEFYLRAASATKNRISLTRIYFDLGRMFGLVRNDSKAVIFLTKAVDVNPNDHIAHAKLARAHSFLGNNALAEFHFVRALELRPDDSITNSWYQRHIQRNAGVSSRLYQPTRK
jgi:tetratricopeptide (TPR) repeat protein